jgi:hypothetical protein
VAAVARTIRIEVEGERGIAREAVLVARADDPRFDADSGRAARHRDAEVRRETPDANAEHDLPAGEADRDPRPELRVAVRADARDAAGRVGGIRAGPGEEAPWMTQELRSLHSEPHRNPATVTAA